jgi:hypothetical protein
MAKIVVECSDPNDLQAVEAATDQFQGKCNVTYFRQAKAMVDAGTAKTLHDASKRIAEDTGESEEAVRHRVRRGLKKVGQHGQPRADTSARPKYHRPLIPVKRIPEEDIYTEGFLDSFNSFFTVLKNAKRLGWKEVSREAALKHLAVLYDLLTIS